MVELYVMKTRYGEQMWNRLALPDGLCIEEWVKVTLLWRDRVLSWQGGKLQKNGAGLEWFLQ